MAAEMGVSEATVRRVWHAHGLKPHLMQTFKVSKDKRFAEKLEIELNAGISSDEVLKEAEAEAERVEAEMFVIARQMWSGAYPKRALPPDGE